MNRKPTSCTEALIAASYETDNEKRLDLIADILDQYGMPEGTRYRKHARLVAARYSGGRRG